MKALSYCALFILLICASCHKTKKPILPDLPPTLTTEMANGLPNNPGEINGYLYASYSGNAVSGNLIQYCTFRDPGADLLSTYNHYTDNQNFSVASIDNFGNIDEGDITFNSQVLFKNNNSSFISYFTGSNSFVTNFSYGCAWRSDGNGSFKPIDVIVTRSFPRFKYPSDNSIPTYSISMSTGLTLNVADLATNFDSVVVSFNNASFFNALKKGVSSSAKTIVFTPAEIQNAGYFVGSGLSLAFYAFNYSKKTIADKIYVFELSNKYTANAIVTQ